MDYRLYLLNACDRFVGVVARTFPDDAEALAAAQSLRGGHSGVEVWAGARCVGRVRAARPPVELADQP